MYPPLPGVAVKSHIMAQYEWFAFCVICTRWSMFQNPLAPWKFHIAYSLASRCCAACAGAVLSMSTAQTAATNPRTPRARERRPRGRAIPLLIVPTPLLTPTAPASAVRTRRWSCATTLGERA
ncbi:hypothetical protein SAMN02787118_109261 [Streptomyces mirabilis]|uniref:Uncharacterized protein n=1 Tax=Streptomyces mirabilis TaxID=68239 RepID=A0A1I2K486_9ACTN|nr:hypothetical protein SAMN02787118_109261 [Streptomyces mirabilis]